MNINNTTFWEKPKTRNLNPNSRRYIPSQDKNYLNTPSQKPVVVFKEIVPVLETHIDQNALFDKGKLFQSKKIDLRENIEKKDNNKNNINNSSVTSSSNNCISYASIIDKPSVQSQPKKIDLQENIEKKEINKNEINNNSVTSSSNNRISYASIASKIPQIQLIFHNNAIFGSYCLEDLRCITLLLEKYGNKDVVKFDCFNYETVESIKKSNQKLAEIFESNMKILNEKKIEFEIHYEKKGNDILEEDNKKIDRFTLDKRKYIEKNSIWDKFKRNYKDTMVFFNPYMINGEGTQKLLNGFFKYAENTLSDKGVVIIKWNPEREDFKNIEIDLLKIAKESNFNCVKKLSGYQFANLTKFVHLKNSTSLEVTKKNKYKNTVKICAKTWDTIYIFNKSGNIELIEKTNVVALSMLNLLEEQNSSIKLKFQGYK